MEQTDVKCQAETAALAEIGQSDADSFLKAKARAVIRVYHAKRWERFSAAKIVAVEEEFAFPLLNPESGAPSRTFLEAGKVDARIVERGANKIIEHKTTADALDGGSHYWDKIEMDTQISKYFLASLQDGWTPSSVLYDVIRRPAQRPKAIPQLDADGLKIVTDDTTDLRAMNKNGSPRQTAGDGMTLKSRPETEEEFEERLFTEISERPDEFLATMEITRLESDIIEYMADAWATGQQILQWRRANLWPRNPDACTAWGSCPYIALCLKRATVDGMQYVKNGRPRHPELSEEVQNGDLALLTNTRSAKLRKCARLHYWAYEERVYPVQEDKEALQFGRLIHNALEAWLNIIKGAQSEIPQ